MCGGDKRRESRKTKGTEGRQIKGEGKHMGGKRVGEQVKDEGWKAEGTRDVRRTAEHNKPTIKKK